METACPALSDACLGLDRVLTKPSRFACTAKIEGYGTPWALSKSEAAFLWEAVEGCGWAAGYELLEAAVPEARAHSIRALITVRHTAWKALFPAGRRGDVLVIDPGLGSVLVSLATDFERLHGLFHSEELMESVRARLEYLGIKNVELTLAADSGRPEFPPDSFDGVVIYDAEPHSLGQMINLLAKSLRSHGWLYATVANPAASWRDRIRFAAQFRKARKCAKRSFALVSTFRHRKDFIAANELCAIDGGAFSARQRAIGRVAPLLAPSFALKAVKSTAPASVIEEVISGAEQQYRAKYGHELKIRVDRQLWSYTVGVTLLVSTSRGRMVIKVPLDEYTCKQQLQNYSALEHLDQMAESRLCAPKPILAGRVADQRFFVEDWLDGERAGRRILDNGRRQDQYVSRAIDWVTRLHVRTAQPCVLEGAELEDLVLIPLRRALYLLSGCATEDELRTIGNFLDRRFRGRMIKLVRLHGDYSVDNLFIAENGDIRGVLDWEFSLPQWLPMLDVFYFLNTIRQVTIRATAGRAFTQTIFPLRLTNREAYAVESYRRALDIPTDLLTPLALMTWIHHLAYRVSAFEPPARVPETYRFTPTDTYVNEGTLASAVRLCGTASPMGRGGAWSEPR
jgi:hypothetical protein